jgi:hypothetical protein
VDGHAPRLEAGHLLLEKPESKIEIAQQLISQLAR